MSDKDKHDLHHFMAQATQEMSQEYTRIHRRSSDDAGTAGDEGEENWAELIKGWVPESYSVVTKGQLMSHSGDTSPQIDVLILKPSYPKRLKNKGKYLAAGVAAAFECKNTLKAGHIEKTIKNAIKIRSLYDPRYGTPYKEMVSPIFYGLLSHSHSWKGEKSKPTENIEKALSRYDLQHVIHPTQHLDTICVADLACWQLVKMACIAHDGAPKEKISNLFDYAGSCHVGHSISNPSQEDGFTPIGLFISYLLRQLAREDASMRDVAEYFKETNLGGNGEGSIRQWPLSIFSAEVRGALDHEGSGKHETWSEWSLV